MDESEQRKGEEQRKGDDNWTDCTEEMVLNVVTTNTVTTTHRFHPLDYTKRFKATVWDWGSFNGNFL
jgi:hypothetical protein